MVHWLVALAAARRNTQALPAAKLLTAIWRAPLSVLLVLSLSPAHADQTVRRSSEFSYDPTTGLLTSERVDPGGPHCVETLYQHDRYGNKTRVEVRSCGAAQNAFPTRVTLNRYDATPGFQAGTVLTATRSGDASLSWSDGADGSTADARTESRLVRWSLLTVLHRAVDEVHLHVVFLSD